MVHRDVTQHPGATYQVPVPLPLWCVVEAPPPERSRGWSQYAEALASRDRDDPNERAWGEVAPT